MVLLDGKNAALLSLFKAHPQYAILLVPLYSTEVKRRPDYFIIIEFFEPRIKSIHRQTL